MFVEVLIFKGKPQNEIFPLIFTLRLLQSAKLLPFNLYLIVTDHSSTTKIFNKEMTLCVDYHHLSEIFTVFSLKSAKTFH